MAEKMTLEEQARELLALEYEVTVGEGPYLTYAKLARSGRGDFTMCSVRAVMRALDLTHITQPAQAVDVGTIREVADMLNGYCEASDDCCYGTLSTSLVRDLTARITRALSNAP